MKLTWTFEEGDEGLMIDDLYQCNELPMIHIQATDGVFLVWECWDDMTFHVLSEFPELNQAIWYIQKRHKEGK